ncbi:uncharacterized protein AB675_317 [Cyphellophora attinorum]|uniref:Uncharacterized protein n=1 Tax=Cyphellophora attinorum TaxID=1664694 RepID=A0A0N1HIA0_9EURO|nr:uncharacterized protein AB675_317 [Phialophora attinorum]KPI46004.1 hypothetical protein AB675_317 [Phialophora attinorum]
MDDDATRMRRFFSTLEERFCTLETKFSAYVEAASVHGSPREFELALLQLPLRTVSQTLDQQALILEEALEVAEAAFNPFEESVRQQHMRSDFEAPQPEVGKSHQTLEKQIREKDIQIAELELNLKRAAEQLKTKSSGCRSLDRAPRQAAHTLQQEQDTTVHVQTDSDATHSQNAAKDKTVHFQSRSDATDDSESGERHSYAVRDTQSIYQHNIMLLMIQRVARDALSSSNTGHNMMLLITQYVVRDTQSICHPEVTLLMIQGTTKDIQSNTGYSCATTDTQSNTGYNTMLLIPQCIAKDIQSSVRYDLMIMTEAYDEKAAAYNQLDARLKTKSDQLREKTAECVELKSTVAHALATARDFSMLHQVEAQSRIAAEQRLLNRVDRLAERLADTTRSPPLVNEGMVAASVNTADAVPAGILMHTAGQDIRLPGAHHTGDTHENRGPFPESTAHSAALLAKQVGRSTSVQLQATQARTTTAVETTQDIPASGGTDLVVEPQLGHKRLLTGSDQDHRGSKRQRAATHTFRHGSSANYASRDEFSGDIEGHGAFNRAGPSSPAGPNELVRQSRQNARMSSSSPPAANDDHHSFRDDSPGLHPEDELPGDIPLDPLDAEYRVWIHQFNVDSFRITDAEADWMRKQFLRWLRVGERTFAGLTKEIDVHAFGPPTKVRRKNAKICLWLI